MFVCHHTRGTILLLRYVDDIVLTGDSPFLNWLIGHLNTELSMKDLGCLHYFLGVEVQRFDGGLCLNQTKYAYELLDRA